MSIAVAIEGPRQGLPSWPRSWLDVIVISTFISTVAAVADYALQLILGRKLDPWDIHVRLDICDTCHRIRRRDKSTLCDCGGRFDDFDNWTWIDGTDGEKAEKKENL